MVKHIVMFNFNDAEGRTAIENAQIAKDNVLSLLGKVPSLRSIEVGLNEIESNGAQTLALIATFDDYEGLEAYDKHPEHQIVVKHIRATGCERHAVDFTF